MANRNVLLSCIVYTRPQRVSTAMTLLTFVVAAIAVAYFAEEVVVLVAVAVYDVTAVFAADEHRNYRLD